MVYVKFEQVNLCRKSMNYLLWVCSLSVNICSVMKPLKSEKSPVIKKIKWQKWFYYCKILLYTMHDLIFIAVFLWRQTKLQIQALNWSLTTLLWSRTDWEPELRAWFGRSKYPCFVFKPLNSGSHLVLDQHDLKVIDQSKNELRALFARWSGGFKCKVFANFGLEGRVGSVPKTLHMRWTEICRKSICLIGLDLEP